MQLANYSNCVVITNARTAHKSIVMHKADVQSTAELPVSVRMERPDEFRPRSTPLHVKSIDGVFGIFHLLRGPYLAVVTNSDTVAMGPGRALIRRVQGGQLFALTSSIEHLSPLQQRAEAEYVAMIEDVFAKGCLYFSLEMELTHTVQRVACFNGSASSGSPWYDAMARPNPAVALARADERFLWNAHVLRELKAFGAEDVVVPCICGFVTTRRALNIQGQQFDLVFISRRSRHRQGTRFNVRGVDERGNVANFVETEQIVLQQSGAISSYVQCRGSIPLYWSQPVTMKYTPKAVISADAEGNQAAFAAHMGSLFNLYGQVTAVNLIDMKGDQQLLGQAFRSASERLADPRLEFVWFDFHKECARMKWENLGKLMARAAPALHRHGMFYQPAPADAGAGSPSSGPAAGVKLQQGCIRTNCIDNLDRTNVVQSIFARWAVVTAVSGEDSLSSGLDTATDVLNSPYPEFEAAFKAIWADNADAISVLYSGTPALKTDFTRTGKRTTMGAVMDGMHSVKRYVTNNLQDGHTQDAWDLFLGRFVVTANPADPTLPGTKAATDMEVGDMAVVQPIVIYHPPTVAPTESAARAATPGSSGMLMRGMVLFAGAATTIGAAAAVARGKLAGFGGSSHDSAASVAESVSSGSEGGLGGFVDEAMMGTVAAGAMLLGVAGYLAKTGGNLGRKLVSRPNFVKHDLVADGVAASGSSSSSSRQAAFVPAPAAAGSADSSKMKSS